MNDYESQMRAFAKYGLNAGERLVRSNSELFLSLDEKTTVEAIISLLRLRAVELPTPASEQDAYHTFARLLGELLSTGAVKVKDFGLSAIGREEFNALVNPEVPSTEPTDAYRDVIQLYKTNVAEFNRMRATSPDFLSRSNRAQEIGVLR